MRLCHRMHSPFVWFVLVMLAVVPLYLFLQTSREQISVQIRRPNSTTQPEIGNLDTRDGQVLKLKDTDDISNEKRVSLLRGHLRHRKGYLTVGLCSVPREGVFYLPSTLASITAGLSDTEKESTVFVIYLGSHNETWVNSVLDVIDTKFKEGIKSGMIQVVQPDPQVYPDFSNITRRTYGDSIERIIWRTRQNVDYAYMFSYSRELSTYYMQVEDDIQAVSGYMRTIKRTVTKYENTDKYWFCLEFSRDGFIGKLFHSSDLLKMKEVFLLFKFEKPCDFLINDVKSLMVQFKPIYSSAALFTHKGKISTLHNKTHVLRNRPF